MLPHTDILLIGPRASGKTTLGRLLARGFNRAFVDLDTETLRAFTWQTIAEVWRAHGEARWREAEAATLSRLLHEGRSTGCEPRVIALGGGTPMIPAALEHLNEARRTHQAVILYLQCPAATLKQRLGDAASSLAARPPLLGSDAVDEVDMVLAAREPTYRTLADTTINAGDSDPNLTLQKALAALDRLVR